MMTLRRWVADRNFYLVGSDGWAGDDVNLATFSEAELGERDDCAVQKGLHCRRLWRNRLGQADQLERDKPRLPSHRGLRLSAARAGRLRMDPPPTSDLSG